MSAHPNDHTYLVLKRWHIIYSRLAQEHTPTTYHLYMSTLKCVLVLKPFQLISSKDYNIVRTLDYIKGNVIRF